MFKQLANIIVSPMLVFQSIKDKPTILFPYLLLLAVLCVSQFVVLNSIDFDYFLDQMVAQQAAAGQATESEIRQGMQFMTPTLMGGISAVSTVIMLSLIFCVYAAYLNLIAKLSDDRYSFRHFFSLIAWTSIPALFSAAASVLNVMLSSSGQFTQAQLNPLSLNSLLFQTSGAYADLLNGVDLTTIWGAVLLVLGYRYLTSTSSGKAAAIVLAPLVVIYGGWALFIAIGS